MGYKNQERGETQKQGAATKQMLRRPGVTAYRRRVRRDELLLLEAEAGKDGRALDPDGIKRGRIKAEELQDGGRYLIGFHKAGVGPGLDRRIRYQQHYVGVVVSETTVLGLLFEASRVDHADVGYDDNVRRAWVAAWAEEAAWAGGLRHAGCVIHCCE